jgi:hypothetical protein
LDVALRLWCCMLEWFSLISCYSQAEAALALWLAPLGAWDCQAQDLRVLFMMAVVVSGHRDDSTLLIIEVS